MNKPLKDKVILDEDVCEWKLKTQEDRKIFLYFKYKDVKKAIIEFSKYKIFFAPYKPKCDNCEENFEYIFNKGKYEKDSYNYCYDCLIKKVFGEGYK